MKIRESVALVTGSNRGLGLALTEALLTWGARKVYAGVRSPFAQVHSGATRVQLDILQDEDIAAATGACNDVNLLINNAGIALPASFLGPDATVAARAQLETNFFGTLAMCRSFAPVLRRNGGGVIVNVLSALSWVNLPTIASYCASKSAAWSLTNGVRNELRAQNTTVIAVHSAFIDTEMSARIQLPKLRPAGVATITLEAIEEGREEVVVDELTLAIKQQMAAPTPGYVLSPEAVLAVASKQ